MLAAHELGAICIQAEGDMVPVYHVCCCCCYQAGVALRRESLGATLSGLQEMLMYGLKGMAAYTHHAGIAALLWH